jgi:hypothetical protein
VGITNINIAVSTKYFSGLKYKLAPKIRPKMNNILKIKLTSLGFICINNQNNHIKKNMKKIGAGIGKDYEKICPVRTYAK